MKGLGLKWNRTPRSSQPRLGNVICHCASRLRKVSPLSLTCGMKFGFMLQRLYAPLDHRDHFDQRPDHRDLFGQKRNFAIQ
jgi:hypothetical protein